MADFWLTSGFGQFHGGSAFLLGEEKLVSKLDSRVELDKDYWVWTHNITSYACPLKRIMFLLIHLKIVDG